MTRHRSAIECFTDGISSSQRSSVHRRLEVALAILGALVLGALAGCGLRGRSGARTAGGRTDENPADGPPTAGDAAGPEAAERLEQHYAARLVELDHERSKIDAIVESVEDGLIVLDQSRAIVHINEVACAILALEARPATETVLESLAHYNPHVARLIAARRARGGRAPAGVKLFLRVTQHT